jgi:1,4-alpha-glucan branching enzyme
MTRVLEPSVGQATAEQQVAEFGSVSLEGINEHTPMGANLDSRGGATFRVWAPNASSVHIRLARTGDVIGKHPDAFRPSDETRLHRFPDGRWAGYVPGVRVGDHYRFYIANRNQPLKRDPYARELEFHDWPNVDCIVRNRFGYPWHDAGFVTPPYHRAIIYQLHFGTFYAVDSQGRDHRLNHHVGRFLDAIDRIPYLAQLGVTFVQPLPVTEFRTPRSLGYNGTDLFSPEMDYGVEPHELASYLTKVNRMLAQFGQPPLELADLLPQTNQLKAFVDLCHLHGMGVLFDVVYNHAGGFDGDDQNLYFFDQDPTGNNNDSLYFTDQGWAGGLVFAYWKREVRQFLFDNARFFIDEYHVDGFRNDEVSVIDRFGGWQFCQDLTNSVRYAKPECLQIAEFWTDDQSWAIRPTSQGGAGFDAVVDAGIREHVRAAVEQASAGSHAHVDLDSVRDCLRRRGGFTYSWQTVQHLENHDKQRVNNDNDREPRIAALADPSNARSWYARSRARVANGLLLTSPGIPMLFMGQEFLEDKYWTDNPDFYRNNLIYWDGLARDRHMRDFHRFITDLIHLRRRHPALCAEPINPFYVHNDNRILAFHRWLEGEGRDIVVVASLNESTFDRYELGFPQSGHWYEAFNSDVYDHWVNPQVAGNGGSIQAYGPARDGLPASATIVIPANGLLVFSRDLGDSI